MLGVDLASDMEAPAVIASLGESLVQHEHDELAYKSAKNGSTGWFGHS